MKSILILVAAFSLISFSAKGQEIQTINQDRGLFTNIEWTQNDTLLVIPQLWFYYGDYYFEWRYNYEDINTQSIFFGRSIKPDRLPGLEIIPMVGISLGQTLGFSTALNVQIEWNRFTLNTELQYTLDFGRGKNSFLYDRSLMLFWFNDYIASGFLYQLYAPLHGEKSHLIGPSIGFSYKSLYFDIGFLDLRNDQLTIYLGIGYTIPESLY